MFKFDVENKCMLCGVDIEVTHIQICTLMMIVF